MTTTQCQGEVSRLLAAEIRAEMGRRQVTGRGLAARAGKPQNWVARRLGSSAKINLTVDDAVEMAQALGLSTEDLFAALLPRLDSNQQPSGYPYALVRAGLGLAA